MVFFYNLLIMISISTVISSLQFETHEGMQCTGSSSDILRDFVGTSDECKAKCEEIGCVGFVRVNSGSQFAEKCYFRDGILSDPSAYSDDDRDCFEVVPGQWTRGAIGATCDATCTTLGGTCNAEIQSTITSCEAVTAAFAEAGYQCLSCIDGRSYAGSPFSTARDSDDCYYLIDGGAESVCDANAVGHHYPLCYCELENDPCLTLDCDDSDECTTDTCDSALGCLYDDVVCDDDDPCTTDSCDSSLGCVYEEIDCGSDLVCVDGECVRDCTTFAMDEFLTDCSVGFNANVDDIDVLQTDVEALEARASVGESRLDEIEGDVEDINTRIDGVDTRIDGVDTRIDGVDTRIDTVDESIAAIHIVLDKFDATTEGEAANVLQDDHDMNGNEGIVYKYLSPENKDALIIFLLVLNMFTMGAGCVTCMKSRGKYKQYESIRNYDTTDVDENRQLQS